MTSQDDYTGEPLGRSSPVFTPGDEPYLGLAAVQFFDQMLIGLAAQQRQIGPWTRTNAMSALQEAAAELVPGACSVTFSIRELVRQGYLLSARILLRPLVERVSTLAYLIDHEDAVDLWKAGWPHKSRPSLATRLSTITGPGEVPADIKAAFDESRQIYNSLVHGDPHSALTSAIVLPDGNPGYTISKDVRSPSRAAEICHEAGAYAMVLTVRSAQVFPLQT